MDFGDFIDDVGKGVEEIIDTGTTFIDRVDKMIGDVIGGGYKTILHIIELALFAIALLFIICFVLRMIFMKFMKWSSRSMN